MRIAIIDSGIEVSHKRLRECTISGISFSEENNEIISSEEFIDELGHGTGIASIIHGCVPNAELVAIKIFHKELKTTEKIVCAALLWCVNNNIKIVNLSLGLASKIPSHDLHAACVDCYNKNIIIIAAAHHTGVECYPAYFPEVFGVSAGITKNKLEYGYISNSPIEFLAKGNVQRIASLNGGFKISDGTSYACANFTGIVSKFLSHNPSTSIIKEIKGYLIENANPNIQSVYKVVSSNENPIIIRNDLVSICEKWIDKEKRFNWLGKIAIFPASEKEMSAFLKIPHHCKYPLSYCIDYPKTFDELINFSENGIVIHKDMPLSDDLKQFDSLVVGYFHENLFPLNVNFGREIVKRIAKEKNLFIYDPNIFKSVLSIEKGEKVNVYCPIVTREMAEDINAFQYMDKITTPLLSVIGTSNRQGKFTTQLRIKEILGAEGYKIAHVSTEPQGELFGADFSFPIGHNSTIEIPFDTRSLFLRSLTKAIEYYLTPDIIITGTQGGVIPRTFTYPNRDIFTMMQFIHGMQPDALICAINPNDSIDFIHKNIEAAKSVSTAKFILATMTPWLREFKGRENNTVADFKFLNKEEMQVKLIYYANELQVPVVDIMDKSNDNLVLETILKFYS